MNLLQLRTEVLAHGFDSNMFSTRINQYLNDALNLVCHRVNWYVTEGTSDFSTVSGTASYAFPADFARARSLHDTSRFMELQYVSVRDIDRSTNKSSAPGFYAIDGANLHLYPVPDGVYTLELRYWKMPPALVNDTDVPIVPDTWQRLLWYWAVRECYAAEDDVATATQWEQQFNTTLAEFEADVKFPDTDGPSQARGMWDAEVSLGQPGWSVWGSW